MAYFGCSRICRTKRLTLSNTWTFSEWHKTTWTFSNEAKKSASYVVLEVINFELRWAKTEGWIFQTCTINVVFLTKNQKREVKATVSWLAVTFLTMLQLMQRVNIGRFPPLPYYSKMLPSGAFPKDINPIIKWIMQTCWGEICLLCVI